MKPGMQTQTDPVETGAEAWALRALGILQGLALDTMTTKLTRDVPTVPQGQPTGARTKWNVQ